MLWLQDATRLQALGPLISFMNGMHFNFGTCDLKCPEISLSLLGEYLLAPVHGRADETRVYWWIVSFQESQATTNLIISPLFSESSANADPRRGSAVADTAVPNPIHHPKDTGVHGVGAGDARSGWLKGEPVDQLQQQEEDDIRKAVRLLLTSSQIVHLHHCCTEAITWTPPSHSRCTLSVERCCQICFFLHHVFSTVESRFISAHLSSKFIIWLCITESTEVWPKVSGSHTYSQQLAMKCTSNQRYWSQPKLSRHIAIRQDWVGRKQSSILWLDDFLGKIDNTSSESLQSWSSPRLCTASCTWLMMQIAQVCTWARSFV